MTCPVTVKQIVSALIAGKFRELDANDRMAFLDADPMDSRICEIDDCTVLIDMEAGIAEVYSYNGPNCNCWQCELAFKEV